jgi:hypothetical protein
MRTKCRIEEKNIHHEAHESHEGFIHFIFFNFVLFAIFAVKYLVSILVATQPR